MLLRALIVATLVFLVDRLSKYWVVELLDLRHSLFIPVLDPWLNFTMAWNQGINFGLMDMGGSGRWVLILLALGITIALAIWVRRRSGWGIAAGTGAIMGGAIGNVWDRLQYGAVADFLNVTCCGIYNPFAFNVADAGIFIGALMIAIFAREKDKEPRRS